VATFRLSKDAKADLANIASYTVAQWGKTQAHDYINGLLERAQQLADQPLIGRQHSELGAGVLAFKYESHIIYYTRLESHITIVRILHKRQDAARHLKAQ
jgi:toxin ParE1/3/4